MRDDPALSTMDEPLNRGGATRQVGTPVLHVDGLSKAFGKTCAVEDVSFTLRDRELVAVLGPSEDDAISLCDGDHSSRLRTGLV